MAEFKLGRIRFVWKGDWTSSTTYYKDDVVKYGGQVYICQVGHESSSNLETDLGVSPARWNLMSEGQEFKNDWTISTYYKLNDIVKYGGILYICTTGHTSANNTTTGLEDDIDKWTVYAEGFDWKSNWTTTTRYKLNDVVKYGGYTYICITAHVSASTSADGLENDSAKWQVFNQGIEYTSTWTATTRYKLNDIVKFGASLYICTGAHTSTSDFATDVTSYWNVLVEGITFEGTWNPSTDYQIGDIVVYGGNQYIAEATNTNQNPFSTSGFWTLFHKGLNWQSDYALSSSYKIGDVVRLNGNTYLALQDVTPISQTVTATSSVDNTFTVSSTTGITVDMAVVFSGTTFGNVAANATYYIKTIPTATTFTISTTQGGTEFVPTTASGSMTAVSAFKPPQNLYWSRLTSGIFWKGDWTDDTEYVLNDVVRFNSSVFVCILAHRSEGDDGSTIGSEGGGAANSRPDQDLTGTYWNLLSIGSETEVLTTAGDLVYFGGAGPVRLPIGTEGQVLVAGAEYPEWQTLGQVDDVYYVSTFGLDNPAPIYGITFDKPWKTIRYACEQIEKGTKNPAARELLELNRIFIQRETTEWILWQIANAAGGSIWENFSYEDFKCERDIGFTIDALIFDITHGGNVKTRGVANALVGAIVEDSPGAYPNIAVEKDQSIAAYNYMLSLVEKVLNQEAPAVNYQTTNGDNSTATTSQYFNADIVTETGAYATAASLVNIITNALEDENASRVPARYRPFSLIKVSTGRYRETLPIIVPERTCVLGDELRSTAVGPATASTDITDTKYSLQTLDRFESVISDIVLGNDVTETSGNTATQSRAWPYADTPETEAIGSLIGALKQRIAFKTGSSALQILTDPTGYNSLFLSGYGDARKLIKENKKFFQEEVIAYLTSQFPLVRYSKTICKRDVGYIVDAVVYDLTYGGYTQSINAGLAYFDGPGGSLMIDSEEKTATIAAYVFLKTWMQSVANNVAVTPLQNTIPQFRGTAGSAGSLTAIGQMIDIITDIINGGTNFAPRVTVTTIASDVCTTSANHGLQVGDSFTPRTTENGFVKRRKYWIITTPAANTFTVSDTFGGSTFSLTNGTGLSIVGDVIDYPVTTDGVTTTTALITAAETLNADQETIVRYVIDELNTVAWHTDFEVLSVLANDTFLIYVGTHSLAHTYVSGGTVTKPDGSVVFVFDFFYDEILGEATIITSTDHGLEDGDIVNIENITVSCTSDEASPITQNAVFPNGFGTRNGITKIRYLQTKCIRDIRLILDAVMFDFMFNSNYQTTKAAFSYLRASASEVFSLGQKTITRNALITAKTEAILSVGDATAEDRIAVLMELLDDVIYSGSNEGDNCATGIRNRDHAVLQLERNRNYIVAEMTAYINQTFKDTVTASTTTTNVLTISDTSWLQRNTAIRFSGTLIGGDNIEEGITYYVQDIISSTQFTIGETRFSTTAIELDNGSGSMTVSLFYNQALCQRDVQRYIDAIKYDLKYPGNYASLLAARYYSNSVTGSLEEDLYYLRDSTGVRDQTLEGLTGDLLSNNDFGTARVSAGAYCSLDPGWGPEDYRAWIIDRSPYVQGVTTFGTACVGQKIDGALHNGGNDSIVSNDFTQVLSDGIGAWVANNGRAELVSVFTYYCHIGYLSTEGGRIRGTNGNCSYGDFGAVAEGVDSREVAGTSVVDNRAFDAQVESTFTNGNQIFTFEFGNAGSDYTEVDWEITGGINASVVQDEFRDDAVYQVRLLDFGDDSSGQFGGNGFITSASTAQAGTSTSITIAATDGQPSTAYIGMKIIITGGTGVGQFGIISSYNSGTKIANVTRENGDAGWDYLIAGIPQANLVSPDASSTYIIEPTLTFSSPGFGSSYSALPSSGDWSDCVYGDTFSTYTSLTGTYPGSGSGASFTVIRNGAKYIPSIQSAGTGYTRLETIVIAGTSLDGLSTANDLTITIIAVDASTGAILEIEHDGYGIGGKFVAIRDGSQVGATSSNGSTWTNVTAMMPVSAAWTSITHGSFDDGSTSEKTGRFVAVAGSSTTASYSLDGTSWSPSILPASANWASVIFGEGKFVAVADDSTTVAISLDGEIWDVTGTLPSTGFESVTYGKGIFVAVKAGNTGAVAYSNDGITWTAANMPTNNSWVNVTYGNNTFVAIASDSNSGAVSTDGITWRTVTIGSADDSSISGYQKIRYGQGLFMATAYLASVQDYSYVATSMNAVDWTIRGVDLPFSQDNNFSGWNAVAFGNPQRIGKWALLEFATGDTSTFISTGATAKARAFVAENKVFAVRITEPGSGYTSTPTLLVTDPNNTYDFPHEIRTGKGALANPTFLNRGTQYVVGNATVFSGDGYADFYQTGGFVAVKRLLQRPVAGSNVIIGGLPNQTFKLVNVVSFLGSNDGAYTAFFQISPVLTVATAPEHEDTVTTRLQYSQVRLTGHDFLNIGTGNFVESNYPGTPVNDPIPANETVENNGGRVFFTSTDQDGNFRVGDLFSIEQSTGVATLNADAFNIAGLQELNLGNVTLGGNSATVTEFSTDPFFTADSDNIVPTQRAIKAYIASQIGGGGASLNVNSVTAGSIVIAGTSISHVSNGTITFTAKANFQKTVTGIPLALGYYLR